jgi:hypothetical protein
MPLQAFEALLAQLLGPSNVATVTSQSLARDGHDLPKIIADAKAYSNLPPMERKYRVDIIFAEPNSKEFGLSIKKR